MNKKVAAIAIVLFISSISYASEAKVHLYFFRGQGCPHCAAEEAFLEKMKLKYSKEILEIHDFEVYYNKENRQKFQQMAAAYSISASGVPATFIGDKAIVGFDSENGIGEKIDRLIAECASKGCIDAGIKGGIKESDGNFVVPDLNSADQENSSSTIFAMAIVAVAAIAAALGAIFYMSKKAAA